MHALCWRETASTPCERTQLTSCLLAPRSSNLNRVCGALKVIAYADYVDVSCWGPCVAARVARHCIMLHAAEGDEGGARSMFEQEAGVIRLDPAKARCHDAA